MNNKTNLALAISALIFSGAANAVVNLNTGAGAAVNTYASEIAMPATLVNTGAMTVVHTLDSAPSIGQTREMHYDLSNATWDVAVASTDLTNPTTAFSSVSISAGGAIGDNYVTFQVTGAAGHTPADNIQFVMPSIDVPTQADVTVTYRQYETVAQAGEAHTGATPENAHLGAPQLLASSPTATLLEFGPALGLSCSEHAYVGVGHNKIDVSQASYYFDANTNDETTQIGGFSVPFNPYLDITGVAITDANVIINSAVITLSGSNGWSAIDSVTDDSFVSIPSSTFNLVGSDYVATGVLLAEYEPLLFSGSPLLGKSLFQASVHPSNATAILPSVITLTSVATANAGYTASTASGSCILGSMTRNGSHDILPFVLTPNGFYTNYVRISNPSSTGGAVYLTLIDDSGQRADFPISDVAGAILPASGTAGSLNAGSSTTLININDIMTAALVANPSLMTTEKFRLEVSAEFGDTGFSVGVGPSLAVTGEGAINGVNVQSFSMSKDGNSFFMLNKN